jgi:hypothetical protein
LGRAVISAWMPAWLQDCLEFTLDRLHLALARRTALRQVIGNLTVFFRVDIAEPQVFQFPFDLPDTQAVGQGSEDVQGFLGYPAAFVLGM